MARGYEVAESRPLIGGSVQDADVGKQTVRKQPSRLISIDLARGLIIIIMAWDHSKDFLAYYKGNDNTDPHGKHGSNKGNHSEMWNGELEMYNTNPRFQFARIISHFCAPGFSFLMGSGMVLLANARRLKTGWSSGRILRFFCLRGTILILLGFVVRGSMLVTLIDLSPQIAGYSAKPYALNFLVGFFQVMTCLGLQMIVVSLWLWLFGTIERKLQCETLRMGPREFARGFFSVGFQPLLFVLLSIGCFASTQAVIHHYQHGDPATADPGIAKSFIDGLMCVLFVPGHLGYEHTTMAYPVVPWLGICCLGVAFGFEFKSNPDMAHIRCAITGVLFLSLFVVIRFFGGSTLNMRGYPLDEGRDRSEWIAFWAVCKYPPSLAYSFLTLGADLSVIYLMSLVKDVDLIWVRIVLTYGKSPLIFYVLHFWVIMIVTTIKYAVSGSFGVSLSEVVPIYFSIVACMGVVCYYYGRFKFSTSPNSLWRLL